MVMVEIDINVIDAEPLKDKTEKKTHNSLPVTVAVDEVHRNLQSQNAYPG